MTRRTHEEEVRAECERRGIEDREPPSSCPHCGCEELEQSSGYVGEMILFCTNGCGVVYEDSVDAIRRVY